MNKHLSVIRANVRAYIKSRFSFQKSLKLTGFVLLYGIYLSG